MRGGAAACRRFNSGPRVDLPDPDLYVQNAELAHLVHDSLQVRAELG
jgi:hypothetical protein